MNSIPWSTSIVLRLLNSSLWASRWIHEAHWYSHSLFNQLQLNLCSLGYQTHMPPANITYMQTTQSCAVKLLQPAAIRGTDSMHCSLFNTSLPNRPLGSFLRHLDIISARLLHRIPIQQRAHCIYVLLTCKARAANSPRYLSWFPYIPLRALHSSLQDTITVSSCQRHFHWTRF